jgi:hypothetical protein
MGPSSRWDDGTIVMASDTHKAEPILRQEAVTLEGRIAALRARVVQRPPTGQEADKAFYDELSGTDIGKFD